jgi:hypothetical protein
MVSMNHKLTFALATLLFGAAQSLLAAEPNQTFATATHLGNGVLSVSDSLFGGTLTGGSGNFPDTLIGSLDLFGQIDVVDDDSSPYGDGRASALLIIPTNSGTIDFLVTGFGDNDFIGDHSEFGDYEYEIEVYDGSGELIDTLSGARTLTAGGVNRITLSEAEWIGGDYSVFLDNSPGATLQGGDVDFFRFSGLTPGATFTAETSDPTATDIDTLLGRYSSTGQFIELNDDYDPELNFLSRLTGAVPASGQLYFAVAGLGDDLFTGVHSETGDYELSVALQSTSPPGDFNGDTFVNAADYTTWRDGLGTIYTAADYNLWRSNFGPSAVVAAAAVPEPVTLALLLCLITVGAGLQRCPRGSGANVASERMSS